MGGVLEGKRVLIAGVLTDDSLGFAVARTAQEQGAELLLTSFGRAMSLTQRTARRLPVTPDVVELDVSQPEHFPPLTAEIERRWGSLDGVVHSIAFAPESCLGGDVMRAPWEDVATAIQVTAYSLKPLVEACVPAMKAAGGGSVVALDFGGELAWPSYNWSGVAKAALRATARYLARDLGPDNIRVNLVSAGPIKSVASRAIPGLVDEFETAWDARAPLGWDVRNADSVGRAVAALLSDLFPATTGEIVHVDGGFHAMGA